MTTIVNTPANTNDSNNIIGVIIGLFIIIVIGFLFFYYGLPLLSQATSPQITVPDKIDVNINQPK